MMNLFTAQEQLRDLSKGQLVQEMQSPSGSIPPFLIMTELQRRTRMESAAALDKGPPQTTVMQDTVNAAGVPQGGLATMAQAMAPQTSMAQNDSAVAQQGQPAPQAAPAAAPVQQMQEGGLAGIKRAQPPTVAERLRAKQLRGRGTAAFDRSNIEVRGDRLNALETMEAAQGQGQLLSDSPTIRALELSGIGANIGEFINEVGIDAIRQADALLASGASLGGRTAAGGTATLGYLASVLGFPDAGAMLERTANKIDLGRKAMMGRTDSERMPFGLEAPRLFTSPTDPGFAVPPEARALKDTAATLRTLADTPDASPLFADGLPNDPLMRPYTLLPASRGPNPSAGVVSDLPESLGIGGIGSIESALALPQTDTPLFGGDRTQFQSPKTRADMDIAEQYALATPQSDLDARYNATQARPDVFPGDARVEQERLAATTFGDPRVGVLGASMPGAPTQVPLVDDGSLASRLGADDGSLAYLLGSGAAGAANMAGSAIDYVAPFTHSAYVGPLARSAFSELGEKLRGKGTPDPAVQDRFQEILAQVAPAAAPPVVPDVADPLAPNIVADPLAPVRPAGPAGLVGASAPPPVTAEDRMFEQDKWLALARFGAALAASKAPTFGQAMGEAGQVGLDALGAARADYQKRKQDAEIMAMKRAAARGGGGGGGGGLEGLADFTANQARQLEVIDNEIAKINQVALGGYTPGVFGTMMGYEAERLDPNTQLRLDRLLLQRKYIMDNIVTPAGTVLAPTAGGNYNAVAPDATKN